MSFRQWLRSLYGPQAAAPVAINNAGAFSITDKDRFFSEFPSSAAGLTVPTAETALQISAVYACVNIIAAAIASLPINIYRRDETGDLAKLHNDALYWTLNEEMVPRWPAAPGWEFLVASVLLTGDGFAEIVRSGPAYQPSGLIPIHPARVTIGVTPDGARLVYRVDPDPDVVGTAGAAARVLDQDDMLHFNGPFFDGVRSLPPLRHALRMSGAVAMATQDYAARFFSNSARPDYVLHSDLNVSKEQAELVKAQLDEKLGGTARAHRPLVLTGGLRPTVISLPLQDLQLLELRRFQVEEIARVFGVPAFLIGHTEKSTSWPSGLEAMGTSFVRYGLRGHLNRIEGELNRKLFRTRAKLLAFDTAELERADLKSLFESYRVALGRAGEPGWMSVEEIRERLKLPRKPAGTLNKGATNEPVVQPSPE